MKKIILFILCGIPFCTMAQKNIFDSIRNLIKIEKNDSERVRLLVQLGNKIKLTDTVESWRCHKAIDSIAKITSNEFFAGQCNF